MVYFLAVVALADVVNVRLGVELMSLAVSVAAIAISRRPLRFFKDWWFFIAGLVMWNLSGAIAAQSPFPAHLAFLLQTDRWLFLGHDPVVLVQHSLAPQQGLGILDYVSAAIYNLHLQEPFIAGYLLWRINRLAYLRFAASVLILLVLGFVTFVLLPAIPPWMAAMQGKIPYVTNRFGPIIRSNPLPFHGTPLFYLLGLHGDKIAAFPSEHAAFPMLEMLAFLSVLGKRALWYGLWVVAVLFSVLYLGEHWLTDVFAGWLYAVVIYWSVSMLTNARLSHIPSPPLLAQSPHSILRRDL